MFSRQILSALVETSRGSFLYFHDKFYWHYRLSPIQFSKKHTEDVDFFSGFNRFRRDIEMMLGSTIPVKAAFFFFGPTWCIISPVALAVSK